LASDLHDLFRGALGPGVHRVVFPAYDVAAAALGHGWVPVVVDLEGVTGKDDLLDRFAAAGRFPDWFGSNWDALTDVLRDLSWLGPADGYVVVLEGWGDVDPGDAGVVEQVLSTVASDWAARGTPFVAVSEG
jgi:Barstar (barnase inhibitor)